MGAVWHGLAGIVGKGREGCGEKNWRINMKKEFNLFKARKADINFPCAWIKKDVSKDLTDVISITNCENNKKVYLQCRTIDDSIEDHRLYKKICASTNPILLSEYYRKKLGIDYDLYKVKNISLDISSPSGIIKTGYFFLKAATYHPEIYGRLSAWLGIIGAFLGFLGVFLGIISLFLAR